MPALYTTHALAEALGARLMGDGAIAVSRVAHPADVRGPEDLAFAADDRLLPLLKGTAARAVVVSAKAVETAGPELAEACIVVQRPRMAMAKLTALFAAPVPVASGIHPSAVVEQGAWLGKNVTVGAMAFVGAGADVGDGCALHPQTYVGPGAKVGADALIYPGARIGAGVIIGARCIVHFNASIGADGFSFVTPEPGSVEQAKATGGGTVSASNAVLERIFSLGSVEIGDDVEIGANTSIDRGTIVSTRIGSGTKIDNQVQIGHNVVIGTNCLICGRVGIAGSAAIGDRVVLGGATGVADHARIGDDAIAMAMSGIAGNVPPRTVVGGFPAMPREKAMENLFHIGRLKSLFKKVDGLAEKLDRLEKDGKSG